jgi:hypothetical protein
MELKHFIGIQLDDNLSKPPTEQQQNRCDPGELCGL